MVTVYGVAATARDSRDVSEHVLYEGFDLHPFCPDSCGAMLTSL